MRIKATYEPDPSTAAVYAELLKEFVNLYKETKGIHKRLERPPAAFRLTGLARGSIRYPVPVGLSGGQPGGNTIVCCPFGTFHANA